MATLGFKVNADYEKVIRLREEISRLETTLSSVDLNTPKAQIASMEQELQRLTTEFTALVQAAAEAGAAIERDFRNKLEAANAGLSEMTQKVEEQKAVVQEAEKRVKALGQAYQDALAKGAKTGNVKGQLDEAVRGLEQERQALLNANEAQMTARASADELGEEVGKMGKQMKKTSKETDDMGLSFSKLFLMLGGANAIKSFIGNIIEVRSQFQDMETQIETLVGKATTAKIMPDIKEMAKTSPLTMTDIVGAEKTMLSFNIAAEDSIKYLKALSDVSMGNSQKFNSLTLAFSQVSSAGKLMGQDLLQMINAGFNPLQTISDKTGKSIAELKEEMSKGAISAQMVQQAFIDATSEGGKFFGMSEAASKTISGQISMMEDAMDAALNEMGQASEGLIMGSIKTITKLIENYQIVGKVILTVAATYGTYRAALLAVTAQEKLAALSRLAQIKHTTTLSLVTGGLTSKIKAMNVALKANPWTFALSALTAIAGAVWTFTGNKREEKKAVEEANEAIAKEVENLDKLVEELKDANTSEERRKEIMEEIKALNPEIVEGIENEADAVAKLIENVEAYNAQKTAEMAINKSDEKSTFQEAKEDLDAAKKEAEDAKAEIINAWTDIKPEILKAIEGGEVPHSLRVWLEKAIMPDDVAIEEKMQRLNAKLISLSTGVRQAGDAEARKWLRDITGDVRGVTGDYVAAAARLGKAEKTYADASAALGKRISDTVNNLQLSAEQAPSIIDNLNQTFLFVPKPATPDTTGKKEEAINLAKEYAKREKEWKEAKKKLEDMEKAREEHDVAAYEAAVADEAKKKKDFQALGGNTSNKPTTTKSKSSTDPVLKRLQQEQQDLQAARKVQDINTRMRRLILESIQEENEREEALRKFENEQDIERIKREKEDYINALVKAEYEKRKEENKTLAKNKRKSTNIDEIRAEVKEREDVKKYDDIARQTEKNTERKEAERKAKKESEDRIKYLKEYGDYKQKVLAITEEYNAKIAKAENQWEKDFLTAERDKVLKDMELAKDAAYQNIFKDPAKMTMASIGAAIELAQGKIKEILSNGTVSEQDLETVKHLQEAVDKLQDYSASEPFAHLGDGTDGVIAKLRQIYVLRQRIEKAKASGNDEAAKNAEEELAVTQNALKKNLAGAAVQGFFDGMEKAAETMREIAEITESQELAGMADAMSKTASSLNSAAMGFLMGGPIGAFVMMVLDGINKIIEAFTNFFVWGAQNTKALQDYAEEMRLSALKINEEAFDTIFGEDKWGAIREAATKLKEAREELEKVRDIKIAVKLDVKDGVTGLINKVNGGNDGTINLANMWVQAKGKGKKKNSGTLSQLFGEDLFDENGNLRTDKIDEAKTALETLKNMKLEDDSAVKALEENIKYAEALKENADYLKDAAADYLNGIGTALGDAIVANILRGEDALDAVGATGAEIITQLGRDLAASFMISSYLNQFSERMTSAFQSSNEQEIANIIGEIVSGFPNMMEQGSELVKQLFDSTKGTEYDVYEYAKENQQQQASAKGYATLSEETGSELSARALAKYESNLRIEASQRESTTAVLDMRESMIAMEFAQQRTNYIAEDCRQLIAESYTQLQAIRENTDAMVGPIKNLSDKMDKWHTKIMEL